MPVDSDVDEVLALVELRLREEAKVDDPGATRALTSHVDGGKRVRARLIVETALTGHTDKQALVSAAAGVELIHLSSLIHDDLIDEAQHRRGRPALHRAVGAADSLLIGNVLAARGMLLACRSAPDAGAALAAASVRVNRGQLLEKSLAIEDEKLFLEYISLKTASLMAAAARMGSILAGHDPAQTDHLDAFGWNFGMMFQMVDDLCDFAGDPAVMGKPIQQDLPNKVFTLPIQNAVANDPSITGLIADDHIHEAYRRMSRSVDLPALTDRWESHANAARRHLTEAVGAGPTWLRELPDRYSRTVLQQHGLVASEVGR